MAGNRIVKRIAVAVVAFGVATGVATYKGHRAENNAPQVGECAKAVGSDKVTKLDCNDPAATLIVTSRHEDTSDGMAACATDPNATSIFEYSNKSTKFVVCLADR